MIILSLYHSLYQLPTAMPEYSPVDYYTSAIPYPHFHGFFPDLIFSHRYGPAALLSLAHYCGYLTYEHPLQEEYGPRLVAPNADIKGLFIEAVLRSLPDIYQHEVNVLVATGMSRAAAVTKCYNRYNNKTPPVIA